MKIKLTESKLRQIVTESVKNLLKEYYDTPYKSFNDDDDVKNYSTFSPEETGYLTNISLDEFLDNRYDEMEKGISVCYNVMMEDFERGYYKDILNDNIALCFFDDVPEMKFYRNAKEFFNGNYGIEYTIKEIIEMYNDIVLNDEESYELGHNDYEYPNQNYSALDINDKDTHDYIYKRIFDEHMISRIKYYFEEKDAIIKVLKRSIK